MPNLTKTGSASDLDNAIFYSGVSLTMKLGVVACLIVVIDSNEAGLGAKIV